MSLSKVDCSQCLCKCLTLFNQWCHNMIVVTATSHPSKICGPATWDCRPRSVSAPTSASHPWVTGECIWHPLWKLSSNWLLQKVPMNIVIHNVDISNYIQSTVITCIYVYIYISIYYTVYVYICISNIYIYMINDICAYVCISQCCACIKSVISPLVYTSIRTLLSCFARVIGPYVYSFDVLGKRWKIELAGKHSGGVACLAGCGCHMYVFLSDAWVLSLDFAVKDSMSSYLEQRGVHIPSGRRWWNWKSPCS